MIVTAPGQEAQVDYGTGPMVRDPESRQYRRTRLFVMTLGCSRKSGDCLGFALRRQECFDSAAIVFRKSEQSQHRNVL